MDNAHNVILDTFIVMMLKNVYKLMIFVLLGISLVIVLLVMVAILWLMESVLLTINPELDHQLQWLIIKVQPQRLVLDQIWDQTVKYQPQYQLQDQILKPQPQQDQQPNQLNPQHQDLPPKQPK